ncbi:hypothetical protein RB653_003677 [Dictyostelium firmibasis]|uniref:RNA helicase n=1 Tax=Dictyostelium firmibasis TaxID=79012 RepID=A0AAN7YRT8_9MYCE
MLGIRIFNNVLKNHNSIRNISSFRSTLPSLASFSRRNQEVNLDGLSNYGGNSEKGMNNNNNNNNNYTSFSNVEKSGYYNDNYDNKVSKEIKWQEESLSTIKKTLIELPTEEQPEAIKFIKENEISVKMGKNIFLPKPVEDIDNVPFQSRIKDLLKKKFEKPTPVQSLGWLIALSGQDMLGISKTGSGKTISFILPAIEHILAQPRQPHYSGPSVLIVAPTRELANQISEEAEQYLRVTNIDIATLYGGAPRGLQYNALKRRPKIIVGTPGRIIDFVEGGELSLKNISFLVVDEADRLMEMGFEDSMETIFNAIRPDRQVLYWSATWPKKVSSLANKYIENPIKLQIGSSELTANKNITQKFKIVSSDSEKVDALMDTLGEIYSENEKAQTLIFTMTKKGASTLCEYIESNGDNVRINTLHGDIPQNSRERIVSNFKNKKIDIVVATDVASRGLDIKGISHVINFSLPSDCETYVHRIGRTGRAGALGTSHSILSMNSLDDMDLISDLTSLLQRSNQEVPKEFLDITAIQRRQQMRSNNNRGGRGNGGKRNYGNNRNYGNDRNNRNRGGSGYY